MINDTRDGLDVAIDRVATQLVSVEPDARLADRIASQLPERGWRLSWLVPQLVAAAGVAVFAFVLFSNRSTKHVEPSAPPPKTIAAAPPVERPPTVAPRAVVRPPVVARRAPALAPLDDSFDREFGLKPVATPDAITLAAISVGSEIVVPAPELAPIVLTDLPLASDSPSPR